MRSPIVNLFSHQVIFHSLPPHASFLCPPRSPSVLKFIFIELVMPSNHLILCTPPFSSCLQSFPAWGSFPVSQLFASNGQSIGASASALPVNIQGSFPLGLTGLISLQSKGLPQESYGRSQVYAQVAKHQGEDCCPSVLWPLTRDWGPRPPLPASGKHQSFRNSSVMYQGLAVPLSFLGVVLL